MQSLVKTLLAAALTITVTAFGQQGPIDRHALVTRHNIEVHALDPNGVLAVGNGEFAFNCDITGMQSFPEYYAKTMPVGILSTWGWHNFPNPEGYSMAKFKMERIPKYDREFVYPASSTSHAPPDAEWLRENEHKFGLGRVGLVMTHKDGTKVKIEELGDIEQRLDLWSGVLTSSFVVDGVPVRVTTMASQSRDEVAVRVESDLVAAGRIKLRIGFPYASHSFGPEYEDWDHPEAHTTTISAQTATSADFARTLDATHYTVRTRWLAGGSLKADGKHEYLLTPKGTKLEFTAAFAPKAEAAADTAAAVEVDSHAGWQRYWTTGGVIDLSGNTDPRAAELERRVVLSQYLMVVHDGGSYPPAETGLGVNSWYGKYHMEMYWWHSAHWALWGHADILERSLNHLHEMMPPGEAMAKLEGAKGVKWSKMTDPTGNESPSVVGPALVWQQPHPIYLAELVYRAHKADAKNPKAAREALDRYKDIVFATADYMATFVDWDPERNEYVLGPGLNSADEKHQDYAHNLNPTMELAYWHWALDVAREWRTRLGMAPDPLWDKVSAHLAKPVVRNGVYPSWEIPVENNAANMTTFAYGALPGTGMDHDAMRNTLHRVTHPDAPQNAVTWGTAMVAMTASRLNEPDLAVSLLVGKYEQNPFRVSGYTVRRPDQTPMYMPANGGWLTAVAMMAAGWDGTTGHAPGFPKEWHVRYEGLLPLP